MMLAAYSQYARPPRASPKKSTTVTKPALSAKLSSSLAGSASARDSNHHGCLTEICGFSSADCLTAIHTVVKKLALRYANLMIRSFGALSAFLAICPIGVYYAASSAASPPGGTGQCSFVLEGPKVVNISGVNYVTASVHAGSCTLHAHTEATVCLSVDGSDSAGDCGSGYDPQPAVVYYPYKPGATYVVKGKGCTDTMQSSDSPATPATICQDISPSRVTL